MKLKLTIYLIIACQVMSILSYCQDSSRTVRFDFYGDPIEFRLEPSFIADFQAPLSSININSFYQRISASDYSSILTALFAYKNKQKPDDWLYYQLIRKTVQNISPKLENYNRYTLYKWFLLAKSGYDAILTFAGDQLLFYVRSDDNIYNIPAHTRNGKQYVCLNYHDYKNVDFEKNKFTEVDIKIAEASRLFTYKITQLPAFRPSDYLEKDLRFNYYDHDYHFKVRLNPEVKTIFANYPVVDYESYFNIPLSRETYSSLIPLLKKNVKGLSVKSGVDYLMRFTRYAFTFEPDSENFGGEKRLSPEQTLLYDYSDCEDRAALLFCLVKEIYNLPMIVLVFPKHVTIAVKFHKPVGKPIKYNGATYSVCDPTPQKQDLNLGQLLPDLKKTPYEVAYVYNPEQR